MDTIIMGAGGHAKMLHDILHADVIGFTDANPEMMGKIIGPPKTGRPVLGGDEIILNYEPQQIRLVNGMGSTYSMALRKAIYEKWSAYYGGATYRYFFRTVIANSVIRGDDVGIGTGAQLMPGAILNAGANIGTNTIINTGAIVEHDCRIGVNCHIAPRATLCGGVTVGHNVHVGVGATVIQGVTIGDNALIAAGAVVVKDVPAGSRVKGVPAEVW